MNRSLKICFIVVLTFFIRVSVIAQTTETLKPRNQFIGLFVNNFDSTLAWYQEKVGFKILQQQSSPDGKFRFAMIEWNGFWIEMIQNPKVVSRQSVAEIKPGNAGTEGFFKLGFYVDDIAYWEKHFKARSVKFKYEMMTNDKFKMKLFILEDPEGNLLQFYSISQ